MIVRTDQHNLVNQTQQGHQDVSRETFAALMDLYELNYLRLKRLFGHFDLPANHMVSSVLGCLDLHAEVLEQTRFTTTIRLSYQFSHERINHEHQAVLEPDLHIRIYRDALMVEVLSGRLQHGKKIMQNMPQTALHERWHLNRFLYKWLGYCLHLGHHFQQNDSQQSTTKQLNRIITRKYSS